MKFSCGSTSLLLLLFSFFNLLIHQRISALVTYTNTTAIFDDTTVKALDWDHDILYIGTFNGLKPKLSSFAIITLKIWLRHSYSEDCVVTLAPPNTGMMFVINRRGGPNANVFDGTLFSDDAGPSVVDYNYQTNVVAQNLKPETLFSNLRGGDLNGDWKILFQDKMSGDDGTISRVTLTITDSCMFKEVCGIGICVGLSASTFSCQCPNGYDGIGCGAVYCPSQTENDSKTKWNQVLATGVTINGQCLDGYDGIISRQCIQSGSTGNWGPISGSCVDIDECSVNNGGCHVNANCTNSIGNFSCTCQEGYSGNGFSCEDINECLTNNGGCDVNANCTNTPGSHTCACKLGFNGNGIHCFQCLENEYPFNETTCLSCPENSSSELGSTSILDCKCTSFNHYPNNQTSTCTPCPLGYLLDEISNICQMIFCPLLETEGCTFSSVAVNQKSYSNCNQNYAIFQDVKPFFPIQGEKGEAICELNNNNITTPGWRVIKSCELSCLIRGCDNNQICGLPTGETIERCFCAGYTGKYCENIDPLGCDTLKCANNIECVNKTDTEAAYCNCSDSGYEGYFCEKDINDCIEGETCYNGGTCYDVGVHQTVCKCPIGFVGDRCELCTPNTCKNGGDCIIQNGASSCNCFGTGYEGEHCQIQKDDCRKGGCENQGRCVVISQNDTASCNCFGTGYEGNQCEIQKEDCRKNGCGLGKCNLISQTDIAFCDCKNTGYKGDFCELAMISDCRTIEYSCSNNGKCEINYQNDSAKCICGDIFKGETCSMEKYSTVDQVTVYYFLAPILVIYLLVCLGIFIQARKRDKSERKSWIFFLLRFLMSCLGIFDLLTDIFFVIESFDYGIEENNFGFFWSSLIFTIVPWSLAAICTGIFLSVWRKKLDSNENNNNFMIFSFFTVVSLLSANGVETFHLVTQYLFLKEGKVIEVSDYAGYLTMYFFIKTVIEDFPQLIIQGIFQSQLGKANPIVTLSLASSALSCFITAVTFPFTHEFEYIKRKLNEMISGSGNFYQSSKEQLYQMQ